MADALWGQARSWLGVGAGPSAHPARLGGLPARASESLLARASAFRDVLYYGWDIRNKDVTLSGAKYHAMWSYHFAVHRCELYNSVWLLKTL